MGENKKIIIILRWSWKKMNVRQWELKKKLIYISGLMQLKSYKFDQNYMQEWKNR